MKKLAFLIVLFSFSTSFLVAQALDTVYFSVSSNNVCHGQQRKLEDKSVFSNDSIISWKWYFGDGDSATGKTVYHIFTPKVDSLIFVQADTFSVTLLIVTKKGNYSVTQNVIVHPYPNVNFIVDNVCEGKYATFQYIRNNKGDKILQYNWYFNNNGDVFDTGDSVQFNLGSINADTLYQTKLECITEFGCKSSTTKTIKVSKQPVAKFSVANTCLGDSTMFENDSLIKNESSVYYLWNFGDGSQGVTFPSPKHLYNASGNYTAKLIAISPSNCKDTDAVGVTINPLPNISLSFVGDTIIYEGNTTTITADGIAASYLWSNNETNKSITVNQSGKYSVEATDANSCKITKSATITVKKVKDKEVAIEENIVTPNGDGINDNFKIADLGAYKKCEVTIYNVWNDEVYSNLDYKNDWSGITKDGKPLDAGTYFYIIKCADHQQTTGSINILR